MTVVFPGLSCDMILVVANIGSDGLLGTEALQSCLPHKLDLRMGQLWAEGQSTLQLHQQRQAPRGNAHLTTSVVLPPDFIGHSAGTLLLDGTLYDFDGRLWCPGRTYPGGCFVVVFQCSDGES